MFDNQFDELCKAYGQMINENNLTAEQLDEAKKAKAGKAGAGAKGFKGGAGSLKAGKKIAQPKVTKFASKMKDLPGGKKAKKLKEDMDGMDMGDEMVDPDLELSDDELIDTGDKGSVEDRIAALEARIAALEAGEQGEEVDMSDDAPEGDEPEPEVED
jgi:hypothetical protein